MSDKEDDQSASDPDSPPRSSKASSPSTKAAPMEEDDNAAEEVPTTVDPNMELAKNELFLEHASLCRKVNPANILIPAKEPLVVQAGYDSKKVLLPPARFMSNIRTSATLGTASLNSGLGLLVDNGKFGPEKVCILKFGEQYAAAFTMTAEGETDEVKLKYDMQHVRFIKESMALELKKNPTFQKALDTLIAKGGKSEEKYSKLKKLINAEPSKAWVKASDVETHMTGTKIKKAPTSLEIAPPKSAEEKAADLQLKADKAAAALEKAKGKKGGRQTTLQMTPGAGPSTAVVPHSGEAQAQTGKLIDAMSGFKDIYDAAVEHGRLKEKYDLAMKQNTRHKKRIAELEEEAKPPSKKKK